MLETEQPEAKYRKRWFLDYVAIFWLFAMVGPGAYIGHQYINPLIFENYPKWQTFNRYFLYYGCVMLASNWLMTKLANTKVAKNYLPPDWQSVDIQDGILYCRICKCYKPARAHHCNLCKKCVIKQDHHCFFVGACIGEGNQRYFVRLTLWMSIGFSYCVLMVFWYVRSEQWRSLGWYDYVILPLSLIRCCLGYLSVYELFCLFTFHSLGIATYASIFIFVSQTLLVCRGLTSFEYKRGVESPVKNYTIQERLNLTFGKLWFINWFIPIDIMQIIMGIIKSIKL